ncbi:hypothetical protein [Naumannella huperziae]
MSPPVTQGSAPGESGHLSAIRFGAGDVAPREPRRRRVPAMGLIILLVVATFSGWLSQLGASNEITYVDRAYPVGATVQHKEADLRVDSIDAATTVNEQPTDGLFLIVGLTLANTRGTDGVSIGHYELVTPDGVTYSASTVSAPRVQPGFRESFRLPVVVDPARLEGLRLRLFDTPTYTVSEPRETVDLGIDAADAERLRASANRAVEIETSTPEGIR